MERFNCRFVDRAGHVFASTLVKASTARQAVETARDLDVHPLSNGFEVWEWHRLVHREAR